MTSQDLLRALVGAFALGMGAASFAQNPNVLKFVFKGTYYAKDSSGKIVPVSFTDQDMLRDRAQAGGVDPRTLAIVYHAWGDVRGDNVEVVSATNGVALVTQFGFWFGNDANFNRTALTNDAGTDIRTVHQVFTLDNSKFTSANSHGVGSALTSVQLVPDKSGNLYPTIGGTMVWMVNQGTDATKMCSGTFTASTPFSTVVVQSGAVPPSATYNGLFFVATDVRASNSGAFTLTTTPRKSFTGNLQVAGRRYPLRGAFDSNGVAQVSIPRGHLPALQVALDLDLNGAQDRLTGTVSDGLWTADLAGARAVYDSRTNQAPEAGKYTLVVAGNKEAANAPGGDGWGTASVNPAGRVRLAGTLADGTRFSQSGLVSSQGQWPVYLSLYGGQGLLLSWMTFANEGTSDLAGDVIWKKPQTHGRYYPQGFTLRTSAVGSQYIPPAGTNSVLDLTSGTVVLSGAGLAAPLESEITLGKSSRVTSVGTNKLTMAFSRANGSFRGSMRDPASSKRLSSSGVALQKQNAGFGFFLKDSESGEVSVGP